MPERKETINQMLDYLVSILGSQNAGALLAIVCDSLDNFIEKANEDERIDTIEVKFNDKHSLKYDCTANEYIKGGLN